MLLPGALPDALLFLDALGSFIAPPLLGVLLLSVLVLPLLRVGALCLPLLLDGLPSRLGLLLLGFGFLLVGLLLLALVSLFTLLFLLRVGRTSDSEKHGQNRCTGDADYFHVCRLLSRITR
jgi:hypothetical protein